MVDFTVPGFVWSLNDKFIWMTLTLFLPLSGCLLSRCLVSFSYFLYSFLSVYLFFLTIVICFAYFYFFIFCLSLSLDAYLSVGRSVCLSFSPFKHPSVFPSLPLLMHQSFTPFLHSFIHPSFLPVLPLSFLSFIHKSICPSLSPSFSSFIHPSFLPFLLLPLLHSSTSRIHLSL